MHQEPLQYRGSEPPDSALIELADVSHDLRAPLTNISACNRIVGRHGGRVWAESGQGRGAVFRFTLGEPR